MLVRGCFRELGTSSKEEAFQSELACLKDLQDPFLRRFTCHLCFVQRSPASGSGRQQGFGLPCEERRD